MPVLLTLRRPFVADHFHDLPGFQEDRHGHNWEVETTLRLEAADGTTAQDGEAALEAWIREVDYTLLNDQAALAGRNPTAEALARWAFLALEARGLPVAQVKMREKANYWAACRR